MQRRVRVCGGAAKPRWFSEQSVILIYIIIQNLAFAAQALHRPLRGIGLEQRAVMVDVVKGDKSDFHKESPLLLLLI